MNLFVKNVKITDPNSAFNGQVCDVIVEKGVIKKIGPKLAKPEGGNIPFLDAGGAILSPGFFDLNCNTGDPGYETKEDLETATSAAAAGGFTGIAVMPGTKPVVHTKGGVEYILNKTRGKLVNVHPIGAISIDREGKELAELYDMHRTGAVAFSDGNKPVTDDGFMSRALQYAGGFGGLVLSFPENSALAGKAQINESSNSILLGMKGNPALAEEMQITREIALAGYHNVPVHIQTISTAGAVQLIKKAKKEGISITCDVAAHHLLLTEELLDGFDSNFKVKPPLRGKADVKALIAGLKDGTIDAIVSQHTPHEIEFKAVEFESAAYGIIALQTVLPLLLAAGLDAGIIADKLTIAPRKILNLPQITIKEGAEANFVIYDPLKKWHFDDQSNLSRSANSPFLNKELTGRVLLTCNNDQYIKYE